MTQTLPRIALEAWTQNMAQIVCREHGIKNLDAIDEPGHRRRIEEI